MHANGKKIELCVPSHHLSYQCSHPTGREDTPSAPLICHCMLIKTNTLIIVCCFYKRSPWFLFTGGVDLHVQTRCATQLIEQIPDYVTAGQLIRWHMKVQKIINDIKAAVKKLALPHDSLRVNNRLCCEGHNNLYFFSNPFRISLKNMF